MADDAITVVGNSFKVLYTGREYSYDANAQFAAAMAEYKPEPVSIGGKKLNPGLTTTESIIFDVPDAPDLVEKAVLQIQGGFTGTKDTLPVMSVQAN